MIPVLLLLAGISQEPAGQRGVRTPACGVETLSTPAGAADCWTPGIARSGDAARKSAYATEVHGSGKLRSSTDEQIASYTKLAASRPGYARYRNLLAKAYIQKVRESADFSYLDRASKLVDGILAGDPGNYDAMRLRSEIELERHNFSLVAQYSEELTRVSPQDPWNWGTLGDAAMELGDYRRAGAAYRKMMALRPDLSSYNRLSYYLFVNGDAAGAITAMQHAILAGSPSPEHIAWCQVDLGALYFRIGKLEDAERAYRAALAAFPGYHPAHAGMGKVQAARGEDRAAIESYRKAHAAVPLAEYAYNLNALYTRTGQAAEAREQNGLIDFFDRMSRAGGEKTDRMLAMIYANQGRKLDRALELLEEELKVRLDVYTYDALAWVLYRHKQYEKAAAASEKALALGTREPAFFYHAGMIAQAQGKSEAAAGFLREALDLNPHFDVTHGEAAKSALAH